MGSKAWPAEDDQIVRDNWGKFSASVIGRRFLQDRYSRNSVIGRAHRMGLDGAYNPNGDPDRAPIAKRTQKPKPIIVAPVVDAPVPFLIDGKNITLLELERGMCKWPVSHMSEPEVFFCGLGQDGKSPYCEFHHGRSVDRSRQTKTAEHVNRSSQGANRVFR